MLPPPLASSSCPTQIHSWGCCQSSDQPKRVHSQTRSPFLQTPNAMEPINHKTHMSQVSKCAVNTKQTACATRVSQPCQILDQRDFNVEWSMSLTDKNGWVYGAGRVRCTHSLILQRWGVELGTKGDAKAGAVLAAAWQYDGDWQPTPHSSVSPHDGLNFI